MVWKAYCETEWQGNLAAIEFVGEYSYFASKGDHGHYFVFILLKYSLQAKKDLMSKQLHSIYITYILHIYTYISTYTHKYNISLQFINNM